jgi:hypothetical protein
VAEPNRWRNISTNLTPPEPLGKLVNPSEYTGTYGSYYLPAIQVSTKPGCDSSLLFQMSRVAGVLHSTQDKDRFLMEITSPWEFKITARDYHNNTVLYNSLFLRNKEGQVRSIELTVNVKIVYTKDITIFDDQVSYQTTSSKQRTLKPELPFKTSYVYSSP